MDMPTAADTTTFKTFDDLVSAANRAGDDKWHRLPYEDALGAQLGFFLYRDDGNGGEERRLLVWHPFGQLSMDITYIDRTHSARIPDVLQGFVGSRTVKYDNPKTLQLGFVHYDRPGYAVGVQFGISAVKSLPTGSKFEIAGRDFMDWRNSLPSLANLAGVAGKYGFRS